MSAFNKLFTSVDGGRWLRKAFNPEGVDEEVNGLPDANIAACCTLNYVGKYDVPVPKTLITDAAQNASYDATIYLYHDPVVVGVCATYPSGSEDIRKAELRLSFDSPSIQITNALNAYFCPRTTRQFTNAQIPGKTVNEKRKYLNDNAQRYRIIYGAAKVIPLCSEDYNSGAMSICQSLMSPEQLGTKENLLGTQVYEIDHVPHCQDSTNPYAAMIFRKVNQENAIKKEQTPAFVVNDADFPNPDDIIQYPNAYYDRYNGGAYIPYKLLNAFDCKFISTESKCQIRTPYWVTGAAFSTDTPLYETTGTYQQMYEQMNWNEMVFDREHQKFSPQTDYNGNEPVQVYAIHCTSYYGFTFDYVFVIASSVPANTVRSYDENSFINTSLPDVCTPYGAHYTDMFSLPVKQGADAQHLTNTTVAVLRGHTNAAQYTVAYPGPYIINDFICNTQNTISIHCTSVNNSASIQLYLRLGMELQSTGSSAFSTIRHTSPPYDEEALKSYTRVMQGLKDALPGDAITPGGQEAYYTYIAERLNAYLNTYYVNNGAKFSGKASVK